MQRESPFIFHFCHSDVPKYSLLNMYSKLDSNLEILVDLSKSFSNA